MDIWIHVTLSGVSQAVRNTIRDKHRELRPCSELVITRNVANTEAIVKVRCRNTNWIASLPQSAQDAIIRVYTEADRHEIFDWFYTPAWQPAET